MTLHPIALALSLLGLLVPLAQDDPPAGSPPPVADPSEPVPAGVTFPEGEAARVLAQVRPNQLPGALPERTADWFSEDCWRRTETWRAWAELVLAEAEAPGKDPRRRAELALLARAQHRGQDAWSHVVALDGHPAWIAATAPRLFPGIPPEVPLGPGGRPKTIPEGTVLRPLLPPRPPEAPAWRMHWRTATYGELPVGEATLDLTLLVEGTGVQVEFAHRSGPAVDLGVLVPEPEGHEIRVEYVNWMRQDELREPLWVTVSADDEEPQAVYGRVRPRPASYPTPAADAVPDQLLNGGLWLDLPADDPDRAWLAPLLPLLGELVGAEVRLGRPDPEAPDALSGSGTVVRLGQGADREATLRYLVSAIEGFRLSTPEPAGSAPERDERDD